MTTTDTPSPGLTASVGELAQHAGADLGHTGWYVLDQEQVRRFADLTDDHNPIHVDPDFAEASPFGTTIVHGYFTLAMLAPMVNELLRVEGASVSINYGLDKLRFPSPVPVGARFRCGVELTAVEEIKGGVQLRVLATVEVDGGTKPALVAECLFRHYA